MIRCSHCGKLAPAGATTCQNCGMPLVSTSAGTGIGGAAQSEQSELPAWLESLRAHERPVSSGMGGQQPFSMAELVDENAMPSWMSQDQSRLSENSDMYPALSPTQSSPGSPNQPFSVSALEANSLIDEKSLPAWMREQGSGQVGPGQNLAANSLVQMDSLPAWMKNLDQMEQSQPPAPPRPYSAPVTPPAQMQARETPPATPPLANPPKAPQTPAYGAFGQTPMQGFSAGDLVDAQALPNWMTSGQGPGQPGQSRPVPTERGFSAGELVDQRSVPDWLKSLQGQEKSDPRSAMGVPVDGSGQGMGQGIQNGFGTPQSGMGIQNGFETPQSGMGIQDGFGIPQSGMGMPASSLLDMGAMPNWMREDSTSAGMGAPSSAGYAQGTPQQPMPASSLLDMGAMPNWMREDGASAGTGAPSSAGYGQGAPQQPMAANSLIDMSAMPAWMREADASQQAGARGASQPPRSVPSRPRNEVVPQGQSEAAASIFASMLGVAASSPSLPGQVPVSENNLGVAQGQPMRPPQQSAQPVIPGWQSPQSTPAAPQPQMWQMGDSLPRISATPMGMAQSPNTPGAPRQPGANNPQARSAEWPPYAGAFDSRGAGGGPMSGMGMTGNGDAQASGAKKKGLVDSIRDFFFK